MIVTLTMNPSIDRTAVLPDPMTVGGVNRIASVVDAPGGKGINVTRVLAAGGADTRAVFPAPADDPFVAMCAAADVPTRVVATSGNGGVDGTGRVDGTGGAGVGSGGGAGVRVNLTVTDPDGVTTKLNEPGHAPDPAALDAVRETVIDLAQGSQWVVLCGSLPHGVPDAFYAELVPRLRATGVRVAVDTSDAPLTTLAAGLPDTAPDLVKPNGYELGQLAGVDGVELERRAGQGDLAPVLATATTLRDRGIATALVTLGGAGAVLVDDDEAWHATTAPISVRSTVGAGDSSLAGYLLADTRGLPPAQRLAWAVAHGSVAASLDGTGLPLGLDPATVEATLTRLD